MSIAYHSSDFAVTLQEICVSGHFQIVLEGKIIPGENTHTYTQQTQNQKKKTLRKLEVSGLEASFLTP